MTCECLVSSVKEHFDAGHPTVRWIATGEPVIIKSEGIVGEYFIDICTLCEKEIIKYAVYFD